MSNFNIKSLFKQAKRKNLNKFMNKNKSYKNYETMTDEEKMKIQELLAETQTEENTKNKE